MLRIIQSDKSNESVCKRTYVSNVVHDNSHRYAIVRVSIPPKDESHDIGSKDIENEL